MPTETACDLDDLADSVPSTLFWGGSPCKSVRKTYMSVLNLKDHHWFQVRTPIVVSMNFQSFVEVAFTLYLPFWFSNQRYAAFQTHSRGNFDESSETWIFPSTEVWFEVTVLPSDFGRSSNLAKLFKRKKRQRVHPFFQGSTTSSALCFFWCVCLPVLGPCSTRSLWWISESLATCPQMLQQVASPQGAFCWELTLLSPAFTLNGSNPAPPGI